MACVGTQRHGGDQRNSVESVDWILPGQNRLQVWTVVKTVTKFQVL
jgi:hypothetical protein